MGSGTSGLVSVRQCNSIAVMLYFTGENESRGVVPNGIKQAVSRRKPALAQTCCSHAKA